MPLTKSLGLKVNNETITLMDKIAEEMSNRRGSEFTRSDVLRYGMALMSVYSEKVKEGYSIYLVKDNNPRERIKVNMTGN